MRNDRRVFLSLALGASTLVFASGCANDNLPKYFGLGGLRILDIQADRPEIDPSGGTVTLTPLVSDFGGNGRALTYAYVACADPGISQGVTPSCDQDPTKQSGSGALTLPSNTGYTGTGASFSVSVPSTLLTGRSTADQYNGVAFLILYTVTATATGESTVGLKRVLVSTRPGKNASNPQLVSIQANGQAITSLPTVASDLSPQIPDGTAESYTIQTDAGQIITRTEQITVTWFISAGDLKRSRTDGSSSNAWTPPGSGAGAAPFLVAVLRDDRGGVAFQIVGP